MPQWITDSTGKITGYKTKGGADTVFPFKDFTSLKQKSFCKLSGATNYTDFYFDIQIEENCKTCLLLISSSIVTRDSDFTFSLINNVEIIELFKRKSGASNSHTCALYAIKLSSSANNIRVKQNTTESYNSREINVRIFY